MPIALLALSLAAFAIGTTEFVVVGLLPTIAGAFSVPVATTGTLVVGYAGGVALGGPLLTLATRRLPPRRVLTGLMVFFAAGHVVMAVAPSFSVLLITRVVVASAHGAFFGVGSVVAAGLVPAERRSRAIAIMFTGLTVATVLGVPGGTLLGEHTSWRVPFLAVAALATVAAVAVRGLVPQDVGSQSASEGSSTLIPARRGTIWFALLTTVVGWGAMFIPFTFITPFLEQVSGFGPTAVAALLLVYGAASAAGSILGGRANDAWPVRMLPVTLVALAAVLSLMWLGGGIPWLTVALLFAWGATGFALVPALQARVVSIAGPGSMLASTLNIAAFNVGIAGGSAIGGAMVSAGGLRLTPLVGAAITLAGAALATVGSARRALEDPALHSRTCARQGAGHP
ncbi:MAG: transporter [Chloroflexi bacterium]|jgi:DHA1 family inner membrane transport protein|nr:transporter [Chloroflexota bacterium]